MIKLKEDVMADAIWNSMTVVEKAMCVVKGLFRILAKLAVACLVIVALVKFIVGA